MKPGDVGVHDYDVVFSMRDAQTDFPVVSLY